MMSDILEELNVILTITWWKSETETERERENISKKTSSIEVQYKDT
jgi:hypothetical protein